jgi:hypothetical protein
VKSKVIQFVMLATVFSAAPLMAQGSLVLHAAIVSANYADYATTQRGLNAGAYEANPLGRHGANKMIALKAAGSGLMIGVVQTLWQQDHKTAAIVLAVVTSGATGVVAAHNWKVGSRKLALR